MQRVTRAMNMDQFVLAMVMAVITLLPRTEIAGSMAINTWNG